ncbi:DUF2840 domain-containing protein [Rhodobacter sp. HX-7-19]|uniref:DUF2840 domain-containing protein n=1 Tax=Paragemmobacter kunshanensis TaxID=2583234 RepID=A0A6M1UBD2_9RHOB|nr:DUF2840 domain-containing protein [Rhodobacter kunshanensis]NGQ93021.1 DUF2840 domain-containing protein [Rhodobacter kunshanensis]
MTGQLPPKRQSHASNDRLISSITWVHLNFQRHRVEQWIRFGHPCREQVIDRQRRRVGFASGAVFACVRWAGNEHGTVAARLVILRAVLRTEPFQTLGFVHPGAEILLQLDGWLRVKRTLEIIDAIEALGIDPTAVAPDHWRHVHNRLAAGQAPSVYSSARHVAWLARRRICP